MKHLLSIALIMCCLTGGIALAAAAPAAPVPPGVDLLVPGHAMIRLNSATLQTFVKFLNGQYPQINASAIDAIPSRNIHLLQFVPPDPATLGLLETDLNETYVANGMLRWGELLYEGQASEGRTGSTWVDSVVGASFLTQYASTKLGLPSAQLRTTGAGIVVALLDTGLDSSHPLLQNNVASGGYNFVANSPNTADTGDGQDNDADGVIDEMTGHGTYVAGLIRLVAPDVKILPVTVLNSDGIGDGWTILKGTYFAIDRGVEVINMSLGSTYDSHAMEEAVLEARSLGIAIAAAAGNMNRNTVPEYPAMMKKENGQFMVFGVVATDDQDVKADFSNFSDVEGRHEVFISVPGASTESGGTYDPTRSIVSAIPNGEVAIWEGTSMATPLLSGTLALVRSQHPEWMSNVQSWNAMRVILTNSAVDHYPANPNYANPPELGVGRLNTAAAVASGPHAPRTGDLNNDGAVNVADLLLVINSWALVHTSADINNDGTVNVTDLVLVISNWG